MVLCVHPLPHCVCVLCVINNNDNNNNPTGRVPECRKTSMVIAEFVTLCFICCPLNTFPVIWWCQHYYLLSELCYNIYIE